MGAGALGSAQQARGHGTDARGGHGRRRQARGSRLERAGLAGGSSAPAQGVEGARACAAGEVQARWACAADRHGALEARAAWALGARPVRTGWASWVLVHPAWFSTWFFDSEFFLSHQMNTVHCKTNFKKNIY